MASSRAVWLDGELSTVSWRSPSTISACRNTFLNRDTWRHMSASPIHSPLLLPVATWWMTSLVYEYFGALPNRLGRRLLLFWGCDATREWLLPTERRCCRDNGESWQETIEHTGQPRLLSANTWWNIQNIRKTEWQIYFIVTNLNGVNAVGLRLFASNVIHKHRKQSFPVLQ